MSEQTIEIADGPYDCHATDTNWRFGLYLDPERRRVSHWQFYGAGTPEHVWHNRAVIAALPYGAVGARVEEIVRGDELRDLVAELFDLYEGSAWNGSNHVGRWRGGDDAALKAHALEEAIEALFHEVPTYWSASDWVSGGQWDQAEADDIRKRLGRGESLDDIAQEFVDDGQSNGACLEAGDMLETIESLLQQYPATCDCDCDCDEPATTTDDAGNAVCDACAAYMTLNDGTIVCGQQTDGFERCHECGESISWTGILTGAPGSGQPNYRLGGCECGDNAWVRQENGGSWDWYSFDVPDSIVDHGDPDACLV